MDQARVLELIAENQARQTQLMEAMVDKDKSVQSVQTATALHGPLGIWSTPGLEREVISTHVRTRGLAAQLPNLPSVFTDPRFGALTGVSDDVGDEPANPCDNAPSGYIKACNLQAQFGRVARSTETIEMDKVMLRINRGDFTDLVLIGELLGMAGFNPAGLNPQQILNVITMSEMVQVGVRIDRVLCGHVWTGSPLNNNLGGGYKEFPGLDNQIATGQVDADTNTACPSLDSDVKDFNYGDVCGNAPDIVEYMSALEYFIYSLADDTGMLPAQWVWVMRPQLWQELTACWPCKYNTNRCTSIGGDHQVITDGRENVGERDAMRRGMTIDVNGRTYPVIVDNCISERSNQNDGNLNPGQFASSIYFIPLRVRGNFPVTYMEHLDYRQAATDTALLRGREDFWTDRGIWSWAIENNKWCYELTLKTEQRIVLRTPQLAGRIDLVRYSPLQHIRDPLPSSPYHIDGGISIRQSATDYAVWLSA
jgi:hypothetical protein